MFQQRKKPGGPTGPDNKDEGGLNVKLPKPPSADGAIDKIDDATATNDMAELFEEVFPEGERCRCF